MCAEMADAKIVDNEKKSQMCVYIYVMSYVYFGWSENCKGKEESFTFTEIKISPFFASIFIVVKM